MTPHPFETPADIARRYGCDPAKAPAAIQRIERGVSAFDPLNMPSWRDARAKGHRLAGRARAFEALAKREREAATPEPVEVLRMVKAGNKPRPKDKRVKRCRATGARAAYVASVREREATIAMLVQQGMTNAEIAKKLGLSNKKSVCNILTRMRRQGHEFPERVMVETAPGTPRRRSIHEVEAERQAKRLEWLRLVESGMTHADAAEQAGFRRSSTHKIALRLERQGFTVPRTEKAEASARARKARKTDPTRNVRRRHVWLELVWTGLTQRQASDALGIGWRSGAKFAQQCRAAGLVVPVHPRGVLHV